jgi:hypothetical protein
VCTTVKTHKICQKCPTLGWVYNVKILTLGIVKIANPHPLPWPLPLRVNIDRCINRQQHAEAIFDNQTTIMFKKVEKKYAICIKCISLTDSMFYHV